MLWNIKTNLKEKFSFVIGGDIKSKKRNGGSQDGKVVRGEFSAEEFRISLSLFIPNHQVWF